MEKYFSLLKNNPLFLGVAPNEVLTLLQCLNSLQKSYRKNQIILLAGQPVTAVGIVLSGDVQIIKEDVMGTRTILTALGPGDLFAEAFVCARFDTIPVTILSATDSEILFINYRKIVSTCSAACSFHSKIIENMLTILASKNVLLNQKLECLSKRTTREKLLAFFSMEAQKSKSLKFSIPFNRQELADYLCVDRSAMSSELSKLKKEGILYFNRNNFELHAEHYDPA